MVHPTNFDGVVIAVDVETENAKEMAAIAAATKKKRTSTPNHHHHHHHHRHRNSESANHLQIPSAAALVDNAFARDNTSICNKVVEEKPLESERTKSCFCCLDINTKIAVYLAASTGFCVNLIGFIFYLVQSQLPYGLPSLISALLYLTAIFAQYHQRASLFLPFLIINMAILSLWALLCAYLLILLAFLLEWCVQLITEYFEWNEIDELFGMPVNTQKTQVRVFLGISLGLTIIYLLMECWLWWIIFRGYKAAKDHHAEEWLQNLNKNIRSISIY